MKKTRRQTSLNDVLLAIGIVGTAIYFLCIMLQFMGVYSPDFCGFGLDSSGLLYIGRGHKIEVWEDNRLVRTIDEKYLSRGYAFTLQHNDTIKLSTASKVYILDLMGTNIIEEYEDSGTSTFNSLNRSKYEFVDQAGKQYTVFSLLGILQISQNGTVIFSSTFLENVVAILGALSFPCFFLLCYIGTQNKHI